MVATQHRSSEDRIELLELLLQSDDLEECAQRAVEWLAENASIARALCVAAHPREKRLVGIAGSGIDPRDVSAFSLDLQDESHPLIAALRRGQSLFSDGDGRVFANALEPVFGTAAVSVITLPPRERRPEGWAGLLITSPASGDPAVLWCAKMLGPKFARQRLLRKLAEAEQRLARERSLLYDIINACPDPILLTDPEGRLEIANSRAEALFAAGGELVSEGRHRAVALNNMLFSAALAQGSIEEPGTARPEILLVDPEEGSDLLFELLSTSAGGRHDGTHLVSILRNVTDLRRATQEIEANYQRLRVAEAEVRAERDRLDLIIDSVGDPIVLTDPSGNIVLMNAPAERLFALPPGRRSKRAPRILRANDAHFSSFMSNLFFAGDELRWRGEMSLTDPRTASLMPFEAIAGKVLSDQNEIVGIVTILHDRTEAIEKARLYEQLKHASDELEAKVRQATAELVRKNELLQRQHLELEQASALKSQFLANMSHEFRTPLTAILGYTGMILQGIYGPLSAAQTKSLTRVDSNARHLLTIINDILDIARIEAGKMPLHVELFDVSTVIAELMSQLEPIIARSKLEVSTEVPASLPRLRTDRQKLKQIVLNLLTNALKFTHAGWVRVRAEAVDEGGSIAIGIADSGIGIPASDHDKIFEDFQQGDNSPTREYGGTGLGLSICRRLANMIGARISLKSQPGNGSTFTLTVPTKLGRR